MAQVLTVETALGVQADKLSVESKIINKLSPILIYAGIIMAVIGLILKLLSLSNIDSLYIAGFFLIFIGYGQKVKVGHNSRDIGFMRWGRQGEQLVLENFKMQLTDDYYIINDCNIVGFSGEKSQIDHLIISPNGLFVVETKNYVGKISGNAEDRYITQRKLIKNKEQEFQITNPVSQNEYHCRVLKNFLRLKNINISDEHIKSVIIFANNNTEVNINGIDYDNVFIGKINNATDYISNYRPEDKQLTADILENFIGLFVNNFRLQNDTDILKK